MKSLLITVLVLLVISLGVNTWVLKEVSSVKKAFENQTETQKRQFAGISDEIRKMQQPTQAAKPAAPEDLSSATVSIDDDPMKGDKNAPVTIVEFSDYQCPFCRKFHQQVLPELEKDYISKGKVRYVFRDYPLGFHQQAIPAAIAANCAGEQGKYWELNDFLFQNPGNLKTETILSSAKDMNLDYGEFEQCVNGKKYETEINDDFEDGKKYGVRGTPSFFVGKTEDGKEITGAYIRGARGYEVFKAEIDKILATVEN